MAWLAGNVKSNTPAFLPVNSLKAGIFLNFDRFADRSTSISYAGFQNSLPQGSHPAIIEPVNLE
jgi:hypothetical protein